MAMLALIRRMSTVVEEAPRLTKFSLQAPKCVEVEFSNGNAFKLSAEFLRINSPAVDGKIRSIGGYIWETPCGNNVCRTCRKLWGSISMICTKLGFIHGITSII